MSTEDTNRAVVTLRKGIDKSSFLEEMVTAGYEIHDEKSASKRNFDLVLDKAQVDHLKKDTRIIDVRHGSKQDNGLILTPFITESSKTYNRTLTSDNTHYNWAHAVCTTSTNPFDVGSSTVSSVTYSYPFTLSGKNVDVVIQDSGVDPNHPEFLNYDGTTNRYQNINWPSASGLTSYSQSNNYHRDVDGHGTHVAGTVSGRLYGWAKNANIYSLKILDDPGNTFGVSASLNMLRAWHNAKTNNIPTIVNASWGYLNYYSNIVAGAYRGTTWTSTSMQQDKGMVQGAYNYDVGAYMHPARVSSVDADIEDCIDDGIIFVGAAGNYSHKIDVPSGLDYNNYWYDGTYVYYYNRGSTPSSTEGVICVANISYAHMYSYGIEGLMNSSEKGPRVNICAPGGAIMSAIPTNSNQDNYQAVQYPSNTSYKSKKLSGTSMASPQVTGVLACLLEARPNATQSECLDFLTESGELNRLYDPTTGTASTDYVNFRALQGAANLYLKNPFVSSNPYSVTT